MMCWHAVNYISLTLTLLFRVKKNAILHMIPLEVLGPKGPTQTLAWWCLVRQYFQNQQRLKMMVSV